MIITLCGSTKFKEEFLKANEQLTLKGHIVLMPGFFGHADNKEIPIETKEKLDELHFEKIDMSDAIFVVNKNGYVGKSTSNEISHAMEKHKKIYWLDIELSRSHGLMNPEM